MKYIALLVGILLCVSCSGQYYRSAAGTKMLADQRDFVGSWTGSGKIYAAPNEEGKSWTATANYSNAYDDVFLQKKEIIHFEGSHLLATLSFTGWDLEVQQPIYLSVSNDGNGGLKEQMTLTGENTFLLTRAMVNPKGKTVVETFVTELMGNTYTVTGKRSVDGGEPYISYEGTYQRSSNADTDNVDLKKVSALVPTSVDTNTIACMAGTYKQIGNFMGSPLDGDETIELILGGHAMFINFKFKPEAGDGYLGASLTSWNEDKELFTGFMIANDGMAAPFQAWLSEDNKKLIYEPLTIQGEGLEDERWYADINPRQEDHCLSGVVSDGLLQIEFIKK